MRRYLVDFIFLPDRDGGGQVHVHADSPEQAIQIASVRFARDLPGPWAYELDSVTEV